MRDELLAALAPDAAETTLQAERERTVRSLPTLRLSATRDAEGSAGGKQLKVQNVVWLCNEWNLTVKPFQRKEPVIYI